jgi:hypothetical protein
VHIYICPYCDPCEKAILIRKKADDIDCKYNKEEICAEDHLCKDVMECKKCKNQFTILKKFLREQKRKIKDG